MRRLGFITLLMAFLPAMAVAQSQPVTNASCVVGQNFTPVPFNYEDITVGATAVGLTLSKYSPSSGSPAVMAFLSTDSDADLMRFRVDGTAAPTSSVGHELVGGGSFIVCQASLPKLAMIRSGSVDVTVRVSYFRQP